MDFVAFNWMRAIRGMMKCPIMLVKLKYLTGKHISNGSLI